ncbi:GAF and ANTAR domain-containing protein [uncultured Jatrophihabitans sp.]|uniref:GAF and ANTAR domain-containing protein n=1 Tax=uncultured Jatrophihabitans sp. TaxID=1610747 RepID=UPI0035CC0A4A
MAATFEVSAVTALFREIAAELARAGGTPQVLDQLCAIAVERVDGAEWAGVSEGHRGTFHTVAATGDVVREVDAVQYALASGPCVDAMADDHVFNAPDLAVDPRWPEFGRAAADKGVRSMMSYRLFLEEESDRIAALNLYSGSVAAFDDIDERLAVMLATHGAMALSRAVESARADNLSVALVSSREIGISIGILMATYRIPRDEAFQILRLFSQRTHRKLADIAAEVANTGALPDLPNPRPRRSPASLKTGPEAAANG